MLKNLRTAYGEELLALAKENPRVVALDADLCGSTQSIVVEKNFPERAASQVATSLRTSSFRISVMSRMSRKSRSSR